MIAEKATDSTETASLYGQVTQWAEEQGWTVTPEIPMDARMYSPHNTELSGLKIDTEEGSVHFEPAGKRRDGRYFVNFYGYSTLLRVRFVKEPKGERWQVFTDGGIPFYWELNKENFARLVHDIQQVP